MKTSERREKMRLYAAERRKDPAFAAIQRERVKKWREANREKSRASSQAWREANPERARATNNAWRAKCAPGVLAEKDQRDYRRNKRATHLSRTFGLTAEQYEAMVVAQDGHCAQCVRRDLPEKRLAVDHDHKTGRIRGLLCADCNRGIGLFGDDPERLRAAADYLDRHNLTPDPMLA